MRTGLVSYRYENRGNAFKRPAFHLFALLIICTLLICFTACGSASDAGQSSRQEQSAGSTAAYAFADAEEEKDVPESAEDKDEKNTIQAVSAPEPAPETQELDSGKTDREESMKKLKMEINGTEIPVVWEDNKSVRALMELAAKEPVVVEMSMYGGFEQVGPLGTNLPRNDQPTTTSAGDIVLYSGDQIVVFYGSNSWSYTRLGNMELAPEEISKLLSQGDVSITLSVK